MYPFIESDYPTWLEVRTDLATTTYYIQYDYLYIAFLVDTTNKIIYRTGVMRLKPTSDLVLLTGAKASAVIQDITYTANAYGTAGNSITITYVSDATSVGKEFVTVLGTAITVHIVSGQSTAQQVVTAVEGWNAYNSLKSNAAASAALVSAVVSGNSGNAQTTQGPTSLTGGIAPVTTLSDFEANVKGTATQVNSINDGISIAI
jgi:hypothetical protein